MPGNLLATSRSYPYLAWLAVMALCLYARVFFFSGWIAHDEGSLGQSAERVLNGQIPHLDFDELYSGGLSYLHAVVFKFFGIGVRQIREFHWWIFSIFLMGVFSASRKILHSTGLALFLVTLLTVWGPINYPASMPSWHVLYLCFLGGLALSLASVSQRRESDAWFFWALGGAFLGAAPWIKVTGIYGAIGIFQWFWASWIQRRLATKSQFSRFVGISTILAPALFSVVIQGDRFSIDNFFWFSLPICLHTLVIARMFWLRRLATISGRNLICLTLSFSFVFSGLLIVMISQAGLEALIRGIFILPRLRLHAAMMEPPSLFTILTPLLFFAVTFAIVVRFWKKFRSRSLFVFLLFSLLGFLAGSSDYWYRWQWALLRTWPLVVPILMWTVYGTMSTPPLLFSTLFCWLGLSQFPFAHGIYLIYCLPLGVAALLYASPRLKVELRATILSFLVALATFGVIWTNLGDWRTFGSRFLMREQGRLVSDPRIGIQLPEETARFWEELLPRLRKTIPEGGTLLAFPDAPEISFLAGRPSPDRGFYEFFEKYESRGKQKLERDPSKVLANGVVINLDPEFSEGLSQTTLENWVSFFPRNYVKGKFLILERE